MLLVLSGMLFAFSSVFTGNGMFAAICVGIVILSLALFAKSIRGLFTYNAEIVFSSDGLNITEFSKGGVGKVLLDASWNELSQYAYEFGSRNPMMLITLVTTNGKVISLALPDEEIGEEECLSRRSFLSILLAYMHTYNEGKADGEKIECRRGLLKRAKGKWWLGVFAVAGIIAVTYCILLSEIGWSLFAAAMWFLMTGSLYLINHWQEGRCSDMLAYKPLPFSVLEGNGVSPKLDDTAE